MILPGDVVEYFGDRGHAEYVVNGPTGNSEMDWNLRTNGTGVARSNFRATVITRKLSRRGALARRRT
jgi:hypothetical protein